MTRSLRTRTFSTLIALTGVVFLAPMTLAQATDKKPDEKKPAETTPAKPETKPATTPAATKQEDKLVHVKITTSMGDITVELNETKAPISVKNFLSYVDKKFYDGTIFHRVINGFMIQGGGFTADNKQKKTDPKIKNEWTNGLKNEQYTIAMARIGGDADSATSQFFINVANNSNLDAPQRDGAAYAVFGKVIAGKEVVDKIKAVKTNKGGGGGIMPDQPLETVTITKIERIEKDAPAAATPAKEEKK